MMKKYTVVYCETWMSGSQHHSITTFAHVETNDLKKLISEDDRFGSATCFVFDGHVTPLQEW